MNIPNRKGFSSIPPFPEEFQETAITRQSSMTKMFLADTNLQNRVKAIWRKTGAMDIFYETENSELLKILERVKKSLDKLTARGVKIIFVRTPESGEMKFISDNVVPRKKYWDVLLQGTNTEGIHYSDYDGLNGFACPEWSHLSPADGVLYTKKLVEILKQKKWF
jgi:hypothetical protein